MSDERLALLVVAIVILMNMLARGVGETHAVFLLPLGAEFGWSRASLSSIYSIYMLVLGVMAPFSGWLFDKLGAQATYSLGLTLLGGAFALAGTLNELWQFRLVVGVVGGIGMSALGVVAGAALIRRWFTQRLGVAMGFAFAGLGIGVILIVPLTQLLIDRYGWSPAYQILGLSILALLPISLLLPWRRINAGQVNRSEQAATTHLSTSLNPSSDNDTHVGQASPLCQAARSLPFWGLFNVYFFTSVCVYACTLQIVAYLVDIGFSPIRAASAFGLMGLLSITGLIGSGWLVERLGRLAAVTLTYCCTISGIAILLLLRGAPEAWLLGLFIVSFGLFQGARGPIVSTLAATLYKPQHYAQIHGAITAGMGLGAASGSYLSGRLYDLTQDYVSGFGLGILAGLIAVSQFWFIRELRD